MKKHIEERTKWIQLVNRAADNGKTKLGTPKDSRICSIHFKDGTPTTENPCPTLAQTTKKKHYFHLQLAKERKVTSLTIFALIAKGKKQK